MGGFSKRFTVTRSVGLLSDLAHLGQLLFGLAGVAIATTATRFFANPEYKVGILSAIAAITVTLSILWVARAYRRINAALKTDWNPSVWMMERQSFIMVHDKAWLTVTTSVKIRILRHDVDHINLRVGWTGRGQITISLENKGFSHHLEGTNHDFNRALMIRFDRPRRRGEELELKFTIDARANTGFEPQPYYAVTLLESRLPKKVSLVVSFDQTLTVAAVQREIYASDSALWPLEPPEPIELGTNRSTEWILPRHRRQRYCIRWELS